MSYFLKSFFQSKRTIIALWILLTVTSMALVWRAQFTSDLSAFLPKAPTAEQQLLMDQLRDGVVSRMILIGIEGADAPSRARLSTALAAKMRARVLFRHDSVEENETAKMIAGHSKVIPPKQFVSVNNGEPIHAEKDHAFLFGNRYLLSDKVTPELLSEKGLHDALAESIDLLASPAGLLAKAALPRDPTGEMMNLLGQFNGGNQPILREGVWASRDGMRAILLAQTQAAGSDTDGQQAAVEAIRQDFSQLAQATSSTSSTQAARLLMTGPGVFSVSARKTIQDEATRLSLISSALIATLLLLVYRSFSALLLGLLPVLSGALAGIVAVSLGHGVVHGITLGFGTTLIGEAVDYSIYLFVQSENKVGAPAAWITRFWPTIRLGVLTSICGFAALLFSGFPGLAQLGLYSIAGLLVAACVTRFVLPLLLPHDFHIHDVSSFGNQLLRILQGIQKNAALPWLLGLLLVCATLILGIKHQQVWNHELNSLSPVSLAEQTLDTSLRADLGAPDVRYMVVISAPSQEQALQTAERATQTLQKLVDENVIAAFESPSRYLPSLASQQTRLASLKVPDLNARLERAVQGLPVRSALFKPFLEDVAKNRDRAPIIRADLEETSMALAVDALLVKQGAAWTAFLPLTARKEGSAGNLSQQSPFSIDAVRVREALRGIKNETTAKNDARVVFEHQTSPQVWFVDLKAESDALYSAYLREAITLALCGLLGIVILLAVSLRSWQRVLHVMLPLLIAVLTVAAALVLCGQKLTILHLIGLLLIVAVGSNYALFFDQGGASHASISARTLASLMFANVSTVLGFGLLAFSSVPVLQAIGITVGPGAVLALLFSAIMARRSVENKL